jgi:Tfp pilus assembly protein PilF
LGLGLAYLGEKQAYLAIPELREAAALSANSIDAWEALGRAYLLEGRYQEARDVYHEVLNKKPGDVTAESGLKLANLGMRNSFRSSTPMQGAPFPPCQHL